MWLILLWGCRDPQVEQFLDDRAAAVCARHARCDTLADAGYADEADCLAAQDESAEAWAAEGALECEGFDADAAEACIAAWDVGCDEPPELQVCEAVCGG